MAQHTAPIKTTHKSFAILDELIREREATLEELTTILDMPKATLHGHLSTMVDIGIISNDGGRYRPTLKLLEYGTRVRANMDIFQVARGPMKELTDETGEHTSLVVEEGGKAVILYNVEGDGTSSVITTSGIHTYLHTNACGKAIMAHLDPEHIEEILDEHGLPAMTNETITDREALLEALERVREQGYATNRDEALKGIKAVAAPILDIDEEVVAAVAIFGPSQSIDNNRLRTELPDLVRETANVIEVNYNYE